MIMKKIFISISIAVFAALSACQTILPQEEENPQFSVSGGSGQTVQYFTATIGTDTKTYLEYDPYANVYKTLWSDGDRILVINADTGESEYCYIVEGAGTSTATFAGSLKASRYYAIYGDNVYTNGDDLPKLYLSSYQYSDDSLNGHYFPMFSQSTSKSFSFQNLCSLIKINLTSEYDDFLNYIKVSTNDSNIYVAGDAEVQIIGNEPNLNIPSGDNWLQVDTYAHIGSYTRSVYVVLPAQTYAGGLTFDFHLESGTRTITVTDDVVLRRSHIRNLNLNLSEGGAPQENWVIEMTRDGGNSWSVTQNLEYKDGFFFFDDLYVDEGEQVSIYFYETNAGVLYGCSYDFRDGSYKTNTRVELVEYGAMLNLKHQGYYDIYLNPEEDCFFIMSDYLHPSELPTMDPVLYETYESLETTYENQIAKVRGYVLAKNAFGYILAIDAKYDNYILLYDPYHKVDIDLGYSVDIYAAVKTYNDLKELDVTEVCWYSIISSNYNDVDLRSPFKVEYLSTYNSYKYDYLSVTGILESSINSQNGRTEYTLIVQSPEYFEVIISQPYQDLAEFVGKPVVVEGFHMGHNASGSTPTLKIMLKRIWHKDSIADSSTEDVLPGGSIIVTNN